MKKWRVYVDWEKEGRTGAGNRQKQTPIYCIYICSNSSRANNSFAMVCPSIQLSMRFCWSQVQAKVLFFKHQEFSSYLGFYFVFNFCGVGTFWSMYDLHFLLSLFKVSLFCCCQWLTLCLRPTTCLSEQQPLNRLLIELLCHRKYSWKQKSKYLSRLHCMCTAVHSAARPMLPQNNYQMAMQH